MKTTQKLTTIHSAVIGEERERGALVDATLTTISGPLDGRNLGRTYGYLTVALGADGTGWADWQQARKASAFELRQMALACLQAADAIDANRAR